MTTQVNIGDARTHFSRLVRPAAGGEETVIARAGKPVAMLVPYRAPAERRTPGLLRGRIGVLPGFDEADATIIQEFENGPSSSANRPFSRRGIGGTTR